MIPQTRSRFAQTVRFAVPLCALTGLLLARPSLKITSPTDGTTVHPGESLTVQVAAAPLEAFKLVSVVGFAPIGFGKEVLDSPPYRFNLEIPNSITPGMYAITAMGFTLPGHPVASNPVMSDPVVILVERSDSPVSISVYPTVADFTMDQKRYLQVTGLYADKTTADLTQSSRIKYVSSAPGIATVQAQGIVTPVKPGSAKITITYDDLKLEVPVRVQGIGR
jgi:Bacterial Ig-like domain (group 2)